MEENKMSKAKKGSTKSSKKSSRAVRINRGELMGIQGKLLQGALCVFEDIGNATNGREVDVEMVGGLAAAAESLVAGAEDLGLLIRHGKTQPPFSVEI
jgi:hypothetical protein